MILFAITLYLLGEPELYRGNDGTRLLLRVVIHVQEFIERAGRKPSVWAEGVKQAPWRRKTI